MFNKVRVSKFLLCAFSAGFGANLVGHATLGIENVNQLENFQKTEEDAQKEGLLYVEKDDDNANKGFVYLDVDDDDVTSSDVNSEGNIKRFVKKACGRKSSTVRKVVFGTSLGIGVIRSVIYSFMESPAADAKDLLKALEEKGISVKFLDKNGNEVTTEGKHETVTEKRVDSVNSGDGKGDGASNKSQSNENKSDDSTEDEKKVESEQNLSGKKGSVDTPERQDDNDDAAKSGEINPNDIKNTTKDVTTTGEQDLNSADNQTNSVQSGTSNHDVKTSEENQTVNMGLKEWLLVGGIVLLIIFVVVFIIYRSKKVKSNSLFEKKIKILSSLGSERENPIFLYYHKPKSELPENEKKEDKQGYSIHVLISKTYKNFTVRLIIGSDRVPDLQGIHFKIRKNDFIDYYKSFVGKNGKDIDSLDSKETQEEKYVFLYVDEVSGADLHFQVFSENNKRLTSLDFYASLNTISSEYKRLMGVLTKKATDNKQSKGYSIGNSDSVYS